MMEMDASPALLLICLSLGQRKFHSVFIVCRHKFASSEMRTTKSSKERKRESWTLHHGWSGSLVVYPGQLMGHKLQWPPYFKKASSGSLLLQFTLTSVSD